MKKLESLVLVIALCLTLNSYAEPKATPEETCKGLSELAENIMTMRLQQVPMSKQIAIFDGDDAVAKLGKKLVIKAYEEPDWRTERKQQNAIKSFRDTTYLDCYKSLSK